MDDPSMSYRRLDDSDDSSGRVVYCVVARGQVVLTECSLTSGNFPTVTRVVLSKIQQSQSIADIESSSKVRKTFRYDS